ncbi:MAG: haloacid dehalogenase-like hydrolase [Verrucomicrobiales bacterium]|nr:haloacid dehalogenase-like hydrolase [Verrucomicrobiales bacterium]
MNTLPLPSPLRTAALVVMVFATLVARAADPLPSWNDTGPKRALTAFVEKVTREGSPDFLPPSERIAVFDNDGTLWCEQPMYPQVMFAVDRLRTLAPKHPEWRRRQPFKKLMDAGPDRLVSVTDQELIEIIKVTHTGMTTDEFADIVRAWIATAKHPRTGRLYTEMVYQPMLELLAYLRGHGFKTFIVSAGGVEFMRVWADQVYGVPTDQVVGTTFKTSYELRGTTPVIVRQPKVDFVDDGPGKPIGINKFIGKRPVLAFGNADGDFQMLQWTTTGPGPRLGLLVHHTDGVREYDYDAQSAVGRLDKALVAASGYGWTVVSMKDDWAKIFPKGP